MVEEIEYQNLIEAFHRVSEENKTLFEGKQRDYGPGNIAKFGAYGVLVRLSDKIERLIHLKDSAAQPTFESIEDTWRDISVYGIIGLLCESGQWPGVHK